jgi:hypothetical protein
MLCDVVSSHPPKKGKRNHPRDASAWIHPPPSAARAAASAGEGSMERRPEPPATAHHPAGDHLQLCTRPNCTTPSQNAFPPSTLPDPRRSPVAPGKGGGCSLVASGLPSAIRLSTPGLETLHGLRSQWPATKSSGLGADVVCPRPTKRVRFQLVFLSVMF